MFRNHPKGLATLFFTEMWERFSFYIMLALLTLYMEAPTADGGLGFDQVWSSQIYGMYIGLIYFTPFFGGIVADRFWGFGKTIMAGGLAMMAGHLALAGEGLGFFFAGLALLILGNGLFKPNISSMLGNLYRDRHDLKDQGYGIFYMGINVGALAAPIVATILKRYGWHYAFSCASIGMLLSIIIFWAFRKTVAEGEVPAFKADKQEEEVVSPEVERLRTRALLIIFAVVIFFWMAFKQNGSTLIRWSRDFTATLDTPAGSINFREDASITKAINPFLVIVLSPLLVYLWAMFRGWGREISTPKKMVLGMGLTAISCAVMALAGLQGGDSRKELVDKIEGLQKQRLTATSREVMTLAALHFDRKGAAPESGSKIDLGSIVTERQEDGRLAPFVTYASLETQIKEMESPRRVTVFWLVLAYFFITLGELCISPMGLSVVSKLAPKRSAGMWMGGWFVSTSIGNYMAGFLGMFWAPLNPSAFFTVLVVTSLLAMGLLILFLPRLEAALDSLKSPAGNGKPTDPNAGIVPLPGAGGKYGRQENVKT